MRAGILLLAAGRGQRFGGDKRFANLPDGRRLLEATLDTLQTTGLPLRVCLRPDDDEAQALLRERDVPWLSCPGADRGMGRTIAEGMSGAATWDAVLIALADMPWIAPDTFLAVAGQCARERIVTPVFRGRRGHPVGFGAGCFEALARLDGDRGARELLSRYAGWLEALPVNDPGVLRDVDKPADLG